MLFQLRDRGLLPQGLDTKISDILPDWLEPQQPAGSYSRRGLTVRSLASQSSGLPREIPPGVNETEILKQVGNLELLRPMYSGVAYSNLGLAILGRALEKVSAKAGLGETWEAL